MNKKDKLLKAINQKLDASHKTLLKAFTITENKESVVFRMPPSFFALEDLWLQIYEISKEVGVPAIRADLFATVEELDGILTNIQWLWKSCIPKGFMTLVAGEPGVGKSLITLDLAKIITNGLSFPGSEEKMKPSNVLWIDTEMKQQLLNERSKSLGINRSRMFIPAIGGNLLTKFDAGNQEHIQHVISIIEDKKPELMVVDSLGHSHSRGENRIEEVRPVMDFLTGLARDYNMSILVVHHLNKGNGESTEVSMARVRGSTDITATPVVIYAIERGADSDTVKMRQIKNNIARQQPALSAKLSYLDEDKEIVCSIDYTPYVPPPPKRSKKEVCAEWIASRLKNEKNGVPLTKLVEEGEGQGFTRGNIYSTREILGEQLTFTGTGRMSIWHLTVSQNDNNSIEKIKKGIKKK